jgi:hypothetical protein
LCLREKGQATLHAIGGTVPNRFRSDTKNEWRDGGCGGPLRLRKQSVRRLNSGSEAMERVVMIELTPLQCFIAGFLSTSLICSVFLFLARRHLVKLRKRNPEFFANLAKGAQRKIDREEEGFELRRREVELMERIVENQEVMIGLLRQSLEEKAVT